MRHYFKLHSSRIFSVFLLFGYLLAIFVVFLLPLPAWLNIVPGMALSGFLLFHLFRDAWLLLPASFVAIRFEGGDIVLISRSGDELSGNAARNSVVTPLLTILNVLPHGRKGVRSVVIFPDSMNRERFRELRVLLKWAGNIRV